MAALRGRLLAPTWPGGQRHGAAEVYQTPGIQRRLLAMRRR